MSLKATRLRIYPGNVQHKALPALLGHARFVWNWAVARHKAHLDNDDSTVQSSRAAARRSPQVPSRTHGPSGPQAEHRETNPRTTQSW